MPSFPTTRFPVLMFLGSRLIFSHSSHALVSQGTDLPRFASLQAEKKKLFTSEFCFAYSCYLSAKSLQSCPTLCDPMDHSPPGSSGMGFSRQEHWNGLLCPPPGDRPNPGIEPKSLMSSALTGRFFTTGTTWEALTVYPITKITPVIQVSN